MRRARRAPRRKLKGKGNRPARRRRASPKYTPTESGHCVIKDATITWTLPRKLRSMNVLCTRLARYGDTMAWQRCFEQAQIISTDGSLGPRTGERLKLEVIRLAPSKAFFLDRTNLAGGCKGLEDFLVRAEYLVDDCEDWEDGPHVSQEISPDKKYWTVVRLSRIDA